MLLRIKFYKFCSTKAIFWLLICVNLFTIKVSLGYLVLKCICSYSVSLPLSLRDVHLGALCFGVRFLSHFRRTDVRTDHFV